MDEVSGSDVVDGSNGVRGGEAGACFEADRQALGAPVESGEVSRVPLAVLEREVCRWAAQLAAGTARYLVLLAEFDAREGWAVDGVVTCVQWMSWRLGVSKGTARDQLRVARALRGLPVTREAFGRGALSYSKVRAIARVATEETEGELVQIALSAPAAHLDRLVTGLVTAADEAAAEEGRIAHRRGRGQEPAAPDEVPRFGLRWEWGEDGALTGGFRFAPEDGAAFLALVRAAAVEVERVDSAEAGDSGDTAEDDAGPGAGVGDRRAAVRAAGGDCGGDPGQGARDEDVVVADVAVVVDDGVPGVPSTGGSQTGSSGTGVAASRRDVAARHRWEPPHHVGVEVVRAVLECARRGALLAEGPRRSGVEVVVHVDAALLGGSSPRTGTAGESCATEAGGGLRLETVERLACDAAVRWAVDGPDGATLAMGRRRRYPTELQVRALWRRDRGCIVAGCGRRTFLHAHHVQHWAAGGATDLENLVLLCGQHHRLLHDGEIGVRALGGQRFEVVDGVGRLRDRAPALSGDAERLPVEHPGVAVDALTPDWDGEPLHLSEATGALLSWWATAAAAATGSGQVGADA